MQHVLVNVIEITSSSKRREEGMWRVNKKMGGIRA